MAAVSRTSLHFRSLTTPSFSSSHKYSLKPSRLSVLRSSGNSNSIPRSPNSNRLLVRSVLQTLESADTSVSAAADLGAVPFPKPRVLVSEKLGEAGLEVLRGFGDVDCSYDLSPEELCAKISRFDALIVRSGTKVTRQVFEAAQGRLKVVGRAGVGIDNVDLQAATEFGCLVVNAPTANTIAAAEHGIALLASMARNVAQADASMKADEAVNAQDFSKYLPLYNASMQGDWGKAEAFLQQHNDTIQARLNWAGDSARLHIHQRHGFRIGGWWR